MSKILKIVGIGTVGVIVFFVALMGYFFSQAENNEQSAVASMQTYTQSWKADQEYKVVHVDFAKALETPALIKVTKNVGRLGRLLRATDTAQTSMSIDTEKGETAIVTFKGEFENGRADVEVTLKRHDGIMKLYGFDIKNGKLKTPTQTS